MLSYITIFDLILSITFFTSIITGIYRGFLSEIVSLFSWILAFWSAFNLDVYLFGYFFNFVSSELIQLWLTRLSIIIIILILGSVFNKIFNNYIKLKIPGNLVLGLSFGFLRGLIFISLIILVIEDTPFYNDSWVQEALLLDYAEYISDFFHNLLIEQTYFT